MAGTITVFSYAASATMTEVQTISTLPKDFSGYNTAAEIAFHPIGKFLYASIAGTTASPFLRWISKLANLRSSNTPRRRAAHRATLRLIRLAAGCSRKTRVRIRSLCSPLILKPAS